MIGVSARRRCRLPQPRGAAGLALAVLLAVSGLAAAEPLASVPNPRARDGTWVTDVPGALRARTVAQLNALIAATEQETGVEMAVVVVGSLEGLAIEDAAVRLFERWEIGKRGRDNGVLFLWSTDNRRVRVEVGYGLEGALTDGAVGAILDAYVIPRFRDEEFDLGVLAGVDALLRVASGESIEIPEQDAWPRWLTALLGVGGGLGGGGLLLLVAGKVRRHRPRRCPVCTRRMRRMLESEDDEHLEPGALAEERISSVDYDVWSCAGCAQRVTLRYPTWSSDARKCPQCHYWTLLRTETTVDPPTTSGAGRAQVDEKCAFCNYAHQYSKVLPRLAETHSSSGSSWSSGGGSSGGSFGGGRSGGGGASRGY